MMTSIEYSSFQIVAIHKTGAEQLLSLGRSELEARYFASLHVPELNQVKLTCFVLRRWVVLFRGGYWKTVRTWQTLPMESEDHEPN